MSRRGAARPGSWPACRYGAPVVDVGTARRADWGARWRASLWDYLAILGWIAVLTVLGLVVRAVLPIPAAGSAPPLVVVDLMAFASTVLPVWAYLTLGEAGRSAATWGKRRAGLRVVGPRDERPGLLRVAVRNAVKLLPWQLAHVAVARLALGSDDVRTAVVPVRAVPAPPRGDAGRGVAGPAAARRPRPRRRDPGGPFLTCAPDRPG